MDDPQRSYLFGKSKKVCITIKSGWHIANFSKKFTQKMTEPKFLCGILKLSHDKSLCDVSSKAQSCLGCKLFLFHFLGVCVCVYVCVSVSVCLCACMGHLLIQACLMVWGGKLRISSIRYISCISLFYHWNLANKKILWQVATNLSLSLSMLIVF